jgi:hypothetical protein
LATSAPVSCVLGSLTLRNECNPLCCFRFIVVLVLVDLKASSPSFITTFERESGGDSPPFVSVPHDDKGRISRVRGHIRGEDGFVDD